MERQVGAFINLKSIALKKTKIVCNFSFSKCYRVYINFYGEMRSSIFIFEMFEFYNCFFSREENINTPRIQNLLLQSKFYGIYHHICGTCFSKQEKHRGQFPAVAVSGSLLASLSSTMFTQCV